MDLRSDPSVEKYLSFYDVGTHQSRLVYLKDFIDWLHQKSDWVDATPSSLIEFHRKARHQDDVEYVMVDLIQEYINQKEGTDATLRTRVSSLRSFFEYNRVPLPKCKIVVRATREPVQGKLSPDIVSNLVNASSHGMKAFYLTLFMGLMDEERFVQFNVRCVKGLVDHLRKKGVDEPFLAEFSGRKQTKMKEFFYTFIGRDALTAWKDYFDRERGWPKEGEASFIDRDGGPISKKALIQRHIRLIDKLNYIKRNGKDTSARYGCNLHEFRDVARTLLSLKAESEGLMEKCVWLWMGHTSRIDPNSYDKFYNDKEYVLKNYRIAEKHLNLISGTQSVPTQDTKQLAQQIIKNPEAFKILQDAMVEIVGAKLAPVEQKKD